MFLPLRDENPTRSTPLVTWTLMAINVVVFLFEVVIGDEALHGVFGAFGVVPAELLAQPVGRSYTLISSMFLHGGWMHLIGNMWFLYIFGDNVEDRLGKPLFVLFYLAAGIGAAALQVAVQPASTIPTIGASGAIAGVLGAYAIVYPGARVLTLVWLFIFVRLLHVPAVLFLGFWFAMQFFSGVGALASSGGGGVAWWAHVGGFVVGGAVGYLLRLRSRPRSLRTVGSNPGVIIPFDRGRRPQDPSPRDRRTFH